MVREPRDIELLDLLDSKERQPFSKHVWRVTRANTCPTLGSSPSGRWDNGTFDVLYTSEKNIGAVSEVHYHFSKAPVFPSKLRLKLHELKVELSSALVFQSMQDLEPLGVNQQEFRNIKYGRTQEIADAAQFLGFDGVVAPSARYDCLNYTLFVDCIDPNKIEVIDSHDLDWSDWENHL